MYESYWQLQKKPFECGAETASYYPSEGHQAALLKLRYAIESRNGGALLAGGSGAGKTLLVRLLAERLPPQFTPFVHLVFPQMSTGELLSYLAGELGADEGGGSAATSSTSHLPSTRLRYTVDESIHRIAHRLAANAASGRHAVLAVDEAHLLEGQRTFEALRLLMNFETGSRPGLTLLLVGQTGLLPIVERLPQLDERLSVKCLLGALTVEETMSYVQHRLTLAGAKQPIFTPIAVEAIHRLTRGWPRRINRLCDLSLLIGFAEDRKTISDAEIEAVSQELVTVAPE